MTVTQTRDAAPAPTSSSDLVILIPAYEPDHRLVTLVRGIADQAPLADVLVVDDGSGSAYDAVFDDVGRTGASVVRFPANRGKGAALKSGFVWVASHRPRARVVCADCDGQHTMTDVLNVADQIGDPATMVLGVRAFTGHVPARSRFGNSVTRVLFGAITGAGLSDTQTGLRGYPPELLDWVTDIPGDRFEYELNLLLQAKAAGKGIAEVPIETVYDVANHSSHFRTVRDSALVYRRLLGFGLRRARRGLRFGASSMVGFGVDTALLFVLQALTGSLGLAVVGARVASAAVNFTLNRRWVFEAGRQPLVPALKRYAALAALILVGNYALISSLVGLGVGLAWAKVLTEATLVVASYAVQAVWVFARGRRSACTDSRRPVADDLVHPDRQAQRDRV